MTLHRHHLIYIYIYEVIVLCNVYLGDYSIVEAIGIYVIIVEVVVKGKIKKICIIYVPILQVNLLLVNIFLSYGLKVQFDLNECILKAPDEIMIVMRLRKGNLYEINLPRYMEQMQPIWYNHRRKRVYMSLGIVNLGIWMCRAFMCFKTWWIALILAKFLVSHLHGFVKHILRVNNIWQHFPTMEEDEQISL